MIHYSLLNADGLRSYVDSKEFETHAHIAISYHRAVSQLNNPRLQSKDILLILAYDESHLVGYVGIIPDLLFENKSTPRNIGWLSCLWVSADMRGHKIASQLLSKAYTAYHGWLIGADYVPAIIKLYNSVGLFESPISISGIRLYFRSDLANILAVKSNFFKEHDRFLRIIDRILNRVSSPFIQRKNISLTGLDLSFTLEIDEETLSLMNKFVNNSLCQRSKKELEWIMKYPWIIERDNQDVLHDRYYFTSTADTFRLEGIKISLHNQLRAFLIYSIRDGNLKVPYVYYEYNAIEQITTVIYHLIKKYDIKTVTIFQPDLSDYLLKKNTPALYKKKIIRNYICTEFTKQILSTKANPFYDGDGDCAFV